MRKRVSSEPENEFDALTVLFKLRQALNMSKNNKRGKDVKSILRNKGLGKG